jgi:predicted alpha/beta hydrolase
MIVGIVLGGFVGGLIMASAGGIHGGPTLARVGKGGVVMLAIFMALQELGVATEIVTTAFAILFGAIALALSLSFGLGNRDLAGEVTRNWYRRYREERDNIDLGNRELDRAEGMTTTDDYIPTYSPTIRHSGPHDVIRPKE